MPCAIILDIYRAQISPLCNLVMLCYHHYLSFPGGYTDMAYMKLCETLVSKEILGVGNGNRDIAYNAVGLPSKYSTHFRIWIL
jgi:hypothetical protein